ncbi:MAG: dihydrofolate reductase [Polyangiaceae bacterium]|nr:dihydrofolate reductase [Polyangiaceae bacterium]
MGTLTITTFTTLDGIAQAPGGPSEDGTGGFAHGGWLVPHADADVGTIITDIMTRADAFLLGRRTYEIFAGHWPRVTDPNDPVATRLNTLPKHVASRTLQRADWNNSSIVRDVVKDVAALKDRYRGEIQVHGSLDLAQTLIRHNLIDEYRVWVFPVLLGKGKRLFGEGVVPAALSLVGTRTTSSGVVVSTYKPAGSLKVGSFELAP